VINGPFVDQAIAIIVIAITFLGWLIATCPTSVAYAFIDRAVAIIVAPVTDLDGGLPTGSTGIAVGRCFIHRAVAVIVFRVTDFDGRADPSDTTGVFTLLNAGPRYALQDPAATLADPDGLSWATVTLHWWALGAATDFFHSAIAVIVETIATNLLGARHNTSTWTPHLLVYLAVTVIVEFVTFLFTTIAIRWRTSLI